MNRLNWVVEIGQVNLGVGRGHGLVLSLCKENLMFGVGEEFTLIGVEIDVGTEYLYVTGGESSTAALHTNLNIMILEPDEG